MVIAQQPFCWKWISVTKISKYGQNEYSQALNASYTFQPLMGFWFYIKGPSFDREVICAILCAICPSWVFWSQSLVVAITYGWQKYPALKFYSPWSNDRQLLGRGSVPNAKRKACYRVLITLIFETRLLTASNLPSLWNRGLVQARNSL